MFTPHAGGWDAIEQRALLDHRWWTLEELRATDELVYPREIAAVVQAVLEGTGDRPIRLADSSAYDRDA